jgi:hypothetical protein
MAASCAGQIETGRRCICEAMAEHPSEKCGGEAGGNTTVSAVVINQR